MSKSNLILDFDYDFELLAIISSIKDYRLCWQINKNLSFDFIRQEDIEIYNQKTTQLSYFNLYLFEDEINFLKYYFINNKSLGVALVPELKRVDYLLMIKGNNAAMEKISVMKPLKEMVSVEAVFETNPEELKSRQNLIFE